VAARVRPEDVHFLTAARASRFAVRDSPLAASPPSLLRQELCDRVRLVERRSDECASSGPDAFQRLAEPHEVGDERLGVCGRYSGALHEIQPRPVRTIDPEQRDLRGTVVVARVVDIVVRRSRQSPVDLRDHQEMKPGNHLAGFVFRVACWAAVAVNQW